MHYLRGKKTEDRKVLAQMNLKDSSDLLGISAAAGHQEGNNNLAHTPQAHKRLEALCMYFEVSVTE